MVLDARVLRNWTEWLTLFGINGKLNENGCCLKRKWLEMKKGIAMALVIVLVLMFAACGANETVKSTTEPTQTVQTQPQAVPLRVRVSENYLDVTQTMIDAFEQLHEDVSFEITLECMSESACGNELLDAPEDGADVFVFTDDQLVMLASAGVLEPVELNTAAYFSAAVDAAGMNGTAYAYPMSVTNGCFLYYDTEFFTQEDVQSLNTMVEKAAAAGKTVGMQFGVNGGWYLNSFFAGAGLCVTLNDDAVTNSCDWDGPLGEAVCQSILDMTATGGLVSDSVANLAAAAADGTVAAFVGGTREYSTVQQTLGDRFVCCKLPSFQVQGENFQMATFASFKLVGVNAGSAQAGYAAELAAFLTSEENQLLRFEQMGDCPANTVAAFSDAVCQSPAITALAEQSEYAVVQRVGDNYWASAASLGSALAAGNPDGTELSQLLRLRVAGITAPIA